MDSHVYRLHDNHSRSRVHGGGVEQVHLPNLGNYVSFVASTTIYRLCDSDSWFPGRRLSVSDLTPNVGLSWYFFTEMFDHFRKFFTGVFQVSTVFPSSSQHTFRLHRPFFPSFMSCYTLCRFAFVYGKRRANLLVPTLRSVL